jgi:hypothetical protein
MKASAELSKSFDILPNGPNSAEADQTPPNEEQKSNQSPIKTQE